MEITTVEELLQKDLRCLYSIETQILAAMPKLITEAKSHKLKKALQDHLEETKTQAKRIEELGSDYDVEVHGATDEGMQSILHEGSTTVEEITNPQLKDTAIIDGSEKIEHYEMASYESAMMLARQMGEDDIADVLNETFTEEKNSAELLKGMAMSGMDEAVERVKPAVM